MLFKLRGLCPGLPGVSTGRRGGAVEGGAYSVGWGGGELEITICDLKSESGGRRSFPWPLTEHGAIMAASLPNSPRAVEMSAFVVRAFIRLRDVARTHAELATYSRDPGLPVN